MAFNTQTLMLLILWVVMAMMVEGARVLSGELRK